jgi:hypothetical protein
MTVTLVTSTFEAGALLRFDTLRGAAKDAKAWLARAEAEDGEWAAILDTATGALRDRYQREGGEVVRTHHVLDLGSPVAALVEATGASRWKIGNALGGGTSLVTSAEQSAERVQVSVLARLGGALGGRIEVLYHPAPQKKSTG